MSATRTDGTDLGLEQRIELQRSRLAFAMQGGGCDAARVELDKLNALLAQRSPAQVAKMERDRGLRR